MQKFMAELSSPIPSGELDKAWQKDLGKRRTLPVGFHFDGGRVTITIESSPDDPWQSADFHRTFSAAVHRVDSKCNVRWL